MGTSIHPFIELDYSDGPTPFQAVGDIRAFNEGEFFLWRSPVLFHALGRRDATLVEMGRADPLFLPRGLPPVLSEAVFYRYYHIVEVPSYKELEFDGASSMSPVLPTVTVQEAQRWVAEGYSHYASPVTNALGGLAGRASRILAGIHLAGSLWEN